MGCGLHAPIFSGRVPLVRAGTSRGLQERGWRVLLLSHPTFDFRIAVTSFFIVQSSAASISGIPRLVAVLAAKDDDFFHTNSTRRRGPCGPENSRSGARCRAVGKSCARRASAKPRKASQRAQGEAAHEARTVFGAPAFRRHGLRHLLRFSRWPRRFPSACDDALVSVFCIVFCSRLLHGGTGGFLRSQRS